MSTPANAAIDYGPLPLIQRHYKPVRSSTYGRLSALADRMGTLDLQFDVHHRRGRRTIRTRPWRTGPLRSCHLVFDALCRGLTLLGEEPSHDEALRLSRRIDRQLSERLSQFVSMTEGRYEKLTGRVSFDDDDHSGPASSALPLPMSWVIATRPGLVRETFVLMRRPKTWELWSRMERANTGSTPCRRHVRLCSTEALYEEPALAAELLLFAFLQRQGENAVELDSCPASVVSTDRLRLLECKLALAS